MSAVVENCWCSLTPENSLAYPSLRTPAVRCHENQMPLFGSSWVRNIFRKPLFPDDTRFTRDKPGKTQLGLSVVTLPGLKSHDLPHSNRRIRHRVSSNQRPPHRRRFGTLAEVPALFLGSDETDYVRGVKTRDIPDATPRRNLLPPIKRDNIEIGMGKARLKGWFCDIYFATLWNSG